MSTVLATLAKMRMIAFDIAHATNYKFINNLKRGFA